MNGLVVRDEVRSVLRKLVFCKRLKLEFPHVLQFETDWGPKSAVSVVFSFLCLAPHSWVNGNDVPLFQYPHLDEPIRETVRTPFPTRQGFKTNEKQQNQSCHRKNLA